MLSMPFRHIPKVYCTMQRYGKVVQFYISALMLVTMGTALTVEYTTVGAVFTQIIGTTQIPIIIIIGIVSSVYTAYGGLHISLITDQVQARHFNCKYRRKIMSPLISFSECTVMHNMYNRSVSASILQFSRFVIRFLVQSASCRVKLLILNFTCATLSICKSHLLELQTYCSHAHYLEGSFQGL